MIIFENLLIDIKALLLKVLFAGESLFFQTYRFAMIIRKDLQ